VLESTRRHFASRQQWIPALPTGVVDLEWLAKALKQKVPALVGVMAANNETGVLQPWREALALCREHGAAFFCDAAQSVGKLPARGLGACDFVSGCAHKFGGPQGVGFLKVPQKFRSLLVGGPQEEGRRAGTENVAGVFAMIAALDEREVALSGSSIAEKLSMRTAFEAELRCALPDVEVVGALSERLWNTVSVVMPEVPDCRQRWVVKLDKLGFGVSTGSACASGKEQTSHVLAAMGLTSERASRVLRFSSGWGTSPADWMDLLAGLQRAHAELTG
jgi:cysteine desulfurase